MTWRLAKALATLREQINALSPNRSKVSDGTIGDAAHASTSSDHNPWVKDGKTGIVTALDLTDDEAHGIDSRTVGEVLRRSQDRRIKYIIADGEIANARAVTKGGKTYPAWAWSPYKGKNSHHHHVHISVQPQKALYDDAAPFDLSALKVAPGKAAKPQQAKPANPVLVLGTKGPDVQRLQILLNAGGAKLTIDQDFGPKTLAAVKAFQKRHGLVVDGRVGPESWAALLA
jgi:hypothetical protein